MDRALHADLHALPGRSLTGANVHAAVRSIKTRALLTTSADDLVQHYLQDGNMQYYSIHPPSFMRAYESFWTACAQSGNQPSPAFTCLLLQICANASQRLGTPLKQRLEYDLAENNAQTSRRLFDAADGLSRAMPPGVGNVDMVLRLLLAAAWLKSDGRIVDGWHALSDAVREAQECGMGSDDKFSSSDKMEVEIRRRVWCAVVVWDWQMAEWLSRPMLVGVDSKMPPPNPLVDGTDDGRPSPISNLSYQFRLVQAIGSRFGRLSEIRGQQAVQEVLDTIEEWKRQLPVELSMSDPDLSWDDQYRWLPLQRAQLHSFAQMVRLTPLKDFLISPPKTSASKDLRYSAVQACIDTIDTAMALADVMGPIKVAFHFVIFALFDTSTLICSAIMHEDSQALPHRDRLLDLVRKALAALAAMSSDSISARRSTEILRWLLRRLELITGELFSAHNPELELFTDVATSPAFAEANAEENLTQNTKLHTTLFSSEQPESVPSESVPSLGTVSHSGVDWGDATGVDKDDVISRLWKGGLSAQDLTDFDLGGMESIWDWEALDIDSVF